LLDAGRRAQAEGKPGLARQFYQHLTYYYGQTSEATEGRSRLSQLDVASHPSHLGRPKGMVPRVVNGPMRPPEPTRRPRRGARHDPNRAGRAAAALVTGIGWLLIAAAVGWLALGVAADLTQARASRQEQPALMLTAILQSAGIVLVGAVTLLCGKAARALFDRARATREVVAVERAKGDRGITDL
jgi:hypothetical protein